MSVSDDYETHRIGMDDSSGGRQAVSDKDREAAIEAAALRIAAGAQDEVKYFRDDAADAVDALIAHGWGPRSTVSADKIEDAAGCCGADHVVDLLRECGIEVTE